MLQDPPRSLFKAASEPDLASLPDILPLQTDYPHPPTPPLLPITQSSPPSQSPLSSPRPSPRARPGPSPSFPHPSKEDLPFSEYVVSEFAPAHNLSVSFAPAAASAHNFTHSETDRESKSFPASHPRDDASSPQPDHRPAPRVPELRFDSLPAFTPRSPDNDFQSGNMGRFGKLACIELDEDGAIKPREMTRAEILQEARDTLSKTQPSPKAIGKLLSNPGAAHSPSPELRQFTNMLEPGGTGGRKATQKALRDYLRNSLQARDIRQVDPAFVAKPALWVRHSALVVSLEGLRAIILHNKMFIFDPHTKRSRHLVFIAKQKVMAKMDAENDQPFEFRALEGILIFLAIGLEKEFTSLKPSIEDYLTELPNELTTKMLENLRLLKQQLNHFHARASGVKTILEGLLDDDEEMANMYLTEKHSSHNYHGRSAVDHSEIETMLEAYLQVIDEHVNHAALLNNAIDDTEDLVMIHLDTLRNRLLSVELSLSVVSMTFGIGGVVAGVFGMNIRIPLFEDTKSGHLWFPLVVLLIFVVVLGGSLFALFALRRRGLYSFY